MQMADLMMRDRELTFSALQLASFHLHRCVIVIFASLGLASPDSKVRGLNPVDHTADKDDPACAGMTGIKDVTSAIFSGYLLSIRN